MLQSTEGLFEATEGCMEGNDKDNGPKRRVSRVWALGEFFYYYFLRLFSS